MGFFDKYKERYAEKLKEVEARHTQKSSLSEVSKTAAEKAEDIVEHQAELIVSKCFGFSSDVKKIYIKWKTRGLNPNFKDKRDFTNFSDVKLCVGDLIFPVEKMLRCNFEYFKDIRRAEERTTEYRYLEISKGIGDWSGSIGRIKPITKITKEDSTSGYDCAFQIDEDSFVLARVSSKGQGFSYGFNTVKFGENSEFWAVFDYINRETAVRDFLLGLDKRVGSRNDVEEKKDELKKTKSEIMEIIFNNPKSTNETYERLLKEISNRLNQLDSDMPSLHMHSTEVEEGEVVIQEEAYFPEEVKKIFDQLAEAINHNSVLEGIAPNSLRPISLSPEFYQGDGCEMIKCYVNLALKNDENVSDKISEAIAKTVGDYFEDGEFKEALSDMGYEDMVNLWLVRSI
jgi:hypothetical protein